MKQLVAYVVCQDGPAPNQPELRSFLRSEIPEYMVPSLFVFLKTMPLTANNKVDRKALPAPDSTLASGAVHVAPRDRMDIQMAVLWQQVLGSTKIGIHDNFFDLGGHSLKAAQLFYLIEQVYGRHLPLSTLFQAPTIAESHVGCCAGALDIPMAITGGHSAKRVGYPDILGSGSQGQCVVSLLSCRDS